MLFIKPRRLCSHCHVVWSPCIPSPLPARLGPLDHVDLFRISSTPSNPQAGIGVLCFLCILCAFLEMIEPAWLVCFLFPLLCREMLFLMKRWKYTYLLTYQNISSIRPKVSTDAQWCLCNLITFLIYNMFIWLKAWGCNWIYSPTVEKKSQIIRLT